MSFENNLISKVETEVKYSTVTINDGLVTIVLKGVVGDEIDYPALEKVQDISYDITTELLILPSVNKKIVFKEKNQISYVEREYLNFINVVNWNENNKTFYITSTRQLILKLYLLDGTSIPITYIVEKDKQFEYTIQINLPEEYINNNSVIPCELYIFYDEKLENLIKRNINLLITYSESPGGI